MKKVFVDIYLAFNLGDDLFLDILAKQYLGCQFTVNYLGDQYDTFISQYHNVKRRRYTLLNKISQRLRISEHLHNYNQVAEEHDALIFIGGSIFREEDYHTSLYVDRLNMVRDFKNRGKKVFVLGANFGPFSSDRFLNDYREFFRYCDDVCFRDLYSYELFKEISHVRYAPDIVFQMNLDEYKVKTNTKIVGYSIIDVRHKSGLMNYHSDYVLNMVKSIECLINKGYQCCLMSFCEKEGDMQVINMIKSHLSKGILQNVYVYDYKGDLKEAISLIATFELFIAARFHANIIALLLGIGVIPIIYSPKTVNMLKDMNQDALMINMDELYLLHNEECILKAMDNKSNLDSIQINAKGHFKKLSEFLAVSSGAI